jgi:hypothetical protein
MSYCARCGERRQRVIAAEADGRSLVPKEKNSRPFSALQLGDNEKTVAKAAVG